MIVILKNIAPKTRKQDIKTFVERAVNGGWFQKKGEIIAISILVQRNLDTRAISYHGIVEIEPDVVAERVIKKLNRKLLAGKYATLAEYRNRDSRNDPRKSGFSLDIRIKERRTRDRRGKYEVLVEPEFSLVARKDFHRMG